jgi:AhpD family alkylhydroperoxidase
MNERLHNKRLNWIGQVSEGIEAMRKVEGAIARSGLNPRLLALIKTRASQLHGCAFCLHMHSEEAYNARETPDRLLLLDAWRESALYTEQERAALAWTEALTHVANTHAPDEVYEEVRRHFSDKELVDLSIAIAMINAWNRLAIGFRAAHPSDAKQAA